MKQKQIYEKSDTLDFSEYAAKMPTILLPSRINRMAEQVARQDSAFAFKEGEEEWVRQWAVNSARRKILERMPELEKTKKRIQNSKILKEAGKARSLRRVI